ncbi:MAG: AbrB/MazE/SpoVT family DNA-binding domain-containing protein [Thermoplasmatota archaeon]
MTTCPSCGKGKLQNAKVEEQMFGVRLGQFSGERCNSCKETFLDETAMAELETRAKTAGVWGLGTKARVVKSGNSLVIRIPADLARHLKLQAGAEVYVHPEGADKIVVEIED